MPLYVEKTLHTVKADSEEVSHQQIFLIELWPFWNIRHVLCNYNASRYS